MKKPDMLVGHVSRIPQLTTDGYVACCDYGQFGPEYSPGVSPNS